MRRNDKIHLQLIAQLDRWDQQTEFVLYSLMDSMGPMRRHGFRATPAATMLQCRRRRAVRGSAAGLFATAMENPHVNDDHLFPRLRYRSPRSARATAEGSAAALCRPDGRSA